MSHGSRDTGVCARVHLSALTRAPILHPFTSAAPIRVPTRACDIKSRWWVYTVNNPGRTTGGAGEDEFDTFRPGVFGQHQLEQGAEGTLHLQGVCYFEQPKTLAAVKKIHPKAHWEVMRGTPAQALEYTSKEETRVDGPVTWGNQPQQGKRNDLHDVATILRETVGPVAKKMRAAAEANPSAFIRYHRGFHALASLYEQPQRKSAPASWRPWQRWALQYLRRTPDNRHILWVTDPEGGEGKSTLVQYLITNAPEEYILLQGKVADMAYAYNSQPVVFFDVPRTQLEHMDHLYNFAEQLKNGAIFSTKYESRLKTFRSPHVVFFANQPPVPGKWSADRVIHVNLQEFTPHTIPLPPFIPPALPVDNDNESGDELSQIFEAETDVESGSDVERPNEFNEGG